MAKKSDSSVLARTVTETRRGIEKVRGLGDVKRERIKAEFKKVNAIQVEASRELAAEKIFTGSSGGCIEKEFAYERTIDISQSDLVEGADVGTQAKRINLRLKRGPYLTDFTNDGQYLLAGGERGDAHLIEMGTQRCMASVYPNETIRAAKFCYNENAWALAQKKSVSVYDKLGKQIHCFSTEKDVHGLEYLPFHFLLVSVGNSGLLRYRDMSHGEFAATHKIYKKGTTSVIRHNPYNALINLGHSDGSVTLWTPNMQKPVVEFLAHRAGVTALCPFNRFYVATAGNDGFARIFDVRNASQEVNRIRLPSDGPTSIDASPTGLLAISRGPQVHIWKDLHLRQTTKVESHYLKHIYKDGTRTNSVRFRPFEDLLGVGTSNGVDSMFAPGAGLAAPDAFSDNPYATSKEKATALVKRLLEKLPAATIMLDPLQFGRKV